MLLHGGVGAQNVHFIDNICGLVNVAAVVINVIGHGLNRHANVKYVARYCAAISHGTCETHNSQNSSCRLLSIVSFFVCFFRFDYFFIGIRWSNWSDISRMITICCAALRMWIQDTHTDKRQKLKLCKLGRDSTQALKNQGKCKWTR